MRRLCGLVERFGRDERGVFAVIFGLMAVVLVALSGAVVDYVGLEQNRARGQIALDAVALALQPEMYVTTKAALIERAAALVNDRIGDPRVAARVTDAQINPELGSLSFTGDMTMPTMFVSLVGVPTLSSAIYSEVTRGSLDVEVAVVVDVTGSMNDLVPKGGGGSQPKIEALQTALNQLIDIIVKDEQKPSYSKMAIVPYSMAVHVGAYAEVIRGPITPPTAIAAIDWAASPARTITGATRANPVVITSASHGFVTGDIVYIRSVSGMTQLNNKIYTVEAVNSNSFKLTNTNGTSYSAHSGQNGRVTKCLIASCDLVVKSTGHGLATSDYAYISGTSLKNYANNNNFDWIDNNPSEFDSRFIVWQIDKINADQFSLPDTDPTYQRDYGLLPGSGGTVSCVLQGCQHFRYRNKQLNFRRQEISTCVTERSPNGFTDVPASTTYLGRNYSSSNNPCLAMRIQPLTADKKVLHDLATGMVAAGSTAGHIGIAWGWYMVSPNFAGPWPEASQPAPANKKNVIRAVVIMTDGAFNTAYCDGVIMRDSGDGSGNEGNKNECNSPNGEAFDQAKALCEAMKKDENGIRIYTVAFDVGDIAKAKEIMANCATDASHAHEATSGTDLAAVFEEIGRNLSSLRVTQ